MKRFNNKVLLAILVVLAVGFVLSRFFRAPALESNLKETLITLDTAKVTAIHVDLSTEKEGEIKIVRNEKFWEVEHKAQRASAANAQLRMALTSIQQIRPERMVTRKKDKWNTYKVDSSGTRIKVFDDEKIEADFWVGKSSAGSSYIRIDGDDEVYEVKEPLESAFNKSFADWRDKAFLRLDPTKVERISFRYPGDSSFVVARQQNQWTANNQPADSSSIAKYLEKLKYRDLTEFEDHFTPTAQAQYEVTLTGDKPVLVLKAWIKANNEWIVSSSIQGKVFFSIKDASVIHDLFPSRDLLMLKAQPR